MAYTITLEIDEEALRRYERKIRELEGIREPVGNLMLEHMQQAVVLARLLSPVRTGRMRDSIGILDWDPENLTVEGGVTAPYARFVEFGTRYMNARSFWRPPVWEAWFRMRRAIAKFIGEWWKT